MIIHCGLIPIIFFIASIFMLHYASQADITVELLAQKNYLDNIEHLRGPEGIQHKQDRSINNGKFHPADLVAIVKNVHAVEDCHCMCRPKNDCVAISYVKQLYTCYMHSHENGQLNSAKIKSAIHYEIAVIHGRREAHHKSVDDGDAPMKCGQPKFPLTIYPDKSNRTKRIIGNGWPSFYSIPWLASLRFPSDKSLCGATLIAQEGYRQSTKRTPFVITSAYCVIKFTRLPRLNLSPRDKAMEVCVGSQDRLFTEAHEQCHVWHKILVHHGYLPDYDNDVAIVMANHNFDLNDYVRHICLPEKNEKINPSDQCFIAGWGATTKFDPTLSMFRQRGYLSNMMKAGRVQILDQGFKIVTSPAEGGCCGVHTGKGDAGGPLFCTNDNGVSYALHGIFSNSKLNVLKGRFEDKFAMVSRYILWIEQILGSFGVFGDFRSMNMAAHIFDNPDSQFSNN